MTFFYSVLVVGVGPSVNLEYGLSFGEDHHLNSFDLESVEGILGDQNVARPLDENVPDSIGCGSENCSSTCLPGEGLLLFASSFFIGFCSTIDDLRVRFYLDHDSQRYIDKWIEIAMKKNLKKLELDFYTSLDFRNQITNKYKIQRPLRKMSKVVEGPPHKYLSELEIIGFLGQLMETEFVACLLKRATKLEKVAIHTCFLD
ncbi:hypothetical protein V6N12_035019 [Hibiscus sabdariffa]|uniref:FBD domain-containing protein n=1 Tax=Hibiscus sabdariffa TaxID=183260 RepID=A0ABR2BP33_9ROSI